MRNIVSDEACERDGTTALLVALGAGTVYTLRITSYVISRWFAIVQPCLGE